MKARQLKSLAIAMLATATLNIPAPAHAQTSRFSSHLAILALGQNPEVSETQKNGGRQVTKTTTYRDEKGRVTRRETITEEYDKPGGKNTKTTRTDEEYENNKVKTTKTKSQEHSDDGTKTKETIKDAKGERTVSEDDRDPYGKPRKETDYDEEGKKTSETEYQPPGEIKKKTEYDDKGKTSKVTDYDYPDGKPIKVTEYEKGKKKSETELDKNGKPSRVTEYEDGKKSRETEYEDGKKSKETDYDRSGRKTREVEYDEKGEIKKFTTFHPNGSKKTEADVKDNKPVRTRKWDEKGRLTEDTLPEADSKSVVPILPNRIVPGETFSFTVVNLAGEVVPNQKVVIDGGPNGKIEGVTNLNGVVVAKAPDNWRTARVALGGLALAMLADNRTSGGGGKPSFKNPPGNVIPGTIVEIPGTNLGGDLSKGSVKMGGKNARILAASPSSLKVLVPADLPLGPAQASYSTSGDADDRPTEEIAFSTSAIRLSWESGNARLVTGQTITRYLVIDGSEEPVEILIGDTPGDSVTVVNSGRRTSSGGKLNRIAVQLRATSVGSWNVPAHLANQVKTEYEQDLENAETSRRDAAGWRDSAEADSNESVAEAKRIAAGHADDAARNWDAAAEARKHGDAKKAEAFEKAAKNFDEAAKNYGSDREPGKGKAAADEGKMWERKGKSGG